ncbi:MAG: hypothetical protein ACR2J1_08610, partial [Methyloceanibacter sp.]|uniref:hypothetical protein n=1 Tax=Methyloceanibacter sp. TaxID=1965321 RepID=UPI003D9BF56F
VALAFCIAVGVGLAVLFALGAYWVGDELRAAAPNDPLLEQGAPVFGVILFTTVAPALTLLPALLAVIVGEVLRLRSWIYYVVAGGAAGTAIPLLAMPTGEIASLPQGQWLGIFAVAGFAGGLMYWLLAGARA